MKGSINCRAALSRRFANVRGIVLVVMAFTALFYLLAFVHESLHFWLLIFACNTDLTIQ